MWEAARGRLERVELSIEAAKVAAETLRNHMAECDRRYDIMERLQNERHIENSKRFDRQDQILTRILWSGVAGATGIFGILIDAIFRALNVHIGGG